MIDERYTYEDYVKDFELDYLGFAGVPDGPVPDPSPEMIFENESELNADGSDENIHSSCRLIRN